MNEPSIDVEGIRRNNLEEMKKNIDRAFANRVKITKFNWDGSPVIYTPSDAEDDNKAAEEMNKRLAKGESPEKIKITHQLYLPENIVFTESSHDYFDLIKKCLEKAAELTHTKLSKDKIDKMINKDLKHEFHHAVPILGDNNVHITYQVGIFELPGNRIYLQPGLGMNGVTTLIDYYDLLINPEEHRSDSDDNKSEKINIKPPDTFKPQKSVSQKLKGIRSWIKKLGGE